MGLITQQTLTDMKITVFQLTYYFENRANSVKRP